MLRLLFVSDFTEQFTYNLLRGIMRYSRETEPWVVWRVHPSVKRDVGIKGLVNMALRWKADVVIGQFETSENPSLFVKKGIVVFAQDYKEKFRDIPNITADYFSTGRMAADYYAERGFRNFAFFGFKDHCWSYERYLGFRQRVEELGRGDGFSVFNAENVDKQWILEPEKIIEWLKSLPKPTAVFACDDNQASLLLEICGAAGINVPGDISVLGVDNDEIICNLVSPSLSSIKIDIETGGYLTAKQCAQMLRDKDYHGRDVYLQHVGVVTRGSTSMFATTDPMVLAALEFVKANVDRHINVQDVMKAVPLSRRLLEIRFKEVTGTTLYKYISNQRVERFAELLLSTKDTVNEIALNLDEQDVKSISRRFKSIKGCTPSEYREKALRKM